MNLNGQKINPKHRTVLNGRPLYGYDMKKQVQQQRHKNYHEKISELSQRFIGKQSFVNKPRKSNPRNPTLLMLLIFIVFIVVFGSLIIDIFFAFLSLTDKFH